MKILLSLIICSQVHTTCMPPYSWPETFDSSYDCMMFGYEESMNNMKEKTITIKTNAISQRQYSTLLLELNIMKQQWRSYGVNLQLSAPSLKKIIALGTSNGSDTTKRRTI